MNRISPVSQVDGDQTIAVFSCQCVHNGMDV